MKIGVARYHQLQTEAFPYLSVSERSLGTATESLQGDELSCVGTACSGWGQSLTPRTPWPQSC